MKSQVEKLTSKIIKAIYLRESDSGKADNKLMEHVAIGHDKKVLASPETTTEEKFTHRLTKH